MWDTFWYEKNLQGDIVAAYNVEGRKVADYKYDAWGNADVTTYGGASRTGVAKNPFRYRGYYYDIDLGLYYLNSRYYDAKLCRFISADVSEVIAATPLALTDKNLYAYCDNNPVTRVDRGGEFWNWLVGGIVGAVSGAISASIEGKKETDFWGSVANGAVAGVVTGLTTDIVILTGGTAGAVIAAGAIGGGIGNSLGTLTEYLVTDSKIDIYEVIAEGATGACTGALFGAIAGPQKKMIDDITERAGKKALSRGITWMYAAKRTSKRELQHIGCSFAEEGLSTICTWMITSFSLFFDGGIK